MDIFKRDKWEPLGLLFCWITNKNIKNTTLFSVFRFEQRPCSLTTTKNKSSSLMKGYKPVNLLIIKHMISAKDSLCAQGKRAEVQYWMFVNLGRLRWHYIKNKHYSELSVSLVKSYKEEAIREHNPETLQSSLGESSFKMGWGKKKKTFLWSDQSRSIFLGYRLYKSSSVILCAVEGMN